jgi:hypothetical protein
MEEDLFSRRTCLTRSRKTVFNDVSAARHEQELAINAAEHDSQYSYSFTP